MFGAAAVFSGIWGGSTGGTGDELQGFGCDPLAELAAVQAGEDQGFGVYRAGGSSAGDGQADGADGWFSFRG